MPQSHPIQLEQAFLKVAGPNVSISPMFFCFESQPTGMTIGCQETELFLFSDWAKVWRKTLAD
jgi:hypothetical protein